MFTWSPQPDSSRALKLTIHRIPIQSLQNDIYGCLAWTLPLNPLIRTPNLLRKIKLRLGVCELCPGFPPSITSKANAQGVDEDEGWDEEIPPEPKQ